MLLRGNAFSVVNIAVRQKGKGKGASTFVLFVLRPYHTTHGAHRTPLSKPCPNVFSNRSLWLNITVPAIFLVSYGQGGTHKTQRYLHFSLVRGGFRFTTWNDTARWQCGQIIFSTFGTKRCIICILKIDIRRPFYATRGSFFWFRNGLRLKLNTEVLGGWPARRDRFLRIPDNNSSPSR